MSPYARGKNAKDPVDRFWERVAVGGPDECWEWIAGTFTAGYGALGIDGKTVYAHRFSYELHKGPIPEGAYLRHTCDNPPCVNPAHLIAGTQKENIRDAVRRGRWMSAKRVKHLGKLHESQVIHGMRRRDPAKRPQKPAERLSLPLGWEYASEARKGTQARRIAFQSGARITGIFTLGLGGRWYSEKPVGVVEGKVVAYRPIHP